jgi:hypothetical protein
VVLSGGNTFDVVRRIRNSGSKLFGTGGLVTANAQ